MKMERTHSGLDKIHEEAYPRLLPGLLNYKAKEKILMHPGSKTIYQEIRIRLVSEFSLQNGRPENSGSPQFSRLGGNVATQEFKCVKTILKILQYGKL